MTILSIALSSSRLHLIEGVVNGILKGSQLPDGIIINVSEEGFFLDKGINKKDLPIFDSDKFGYRFHLDCWVEYNYTKNIGPMRAYIPVIEMYQNEPDTTIIVIDDDIGVSKNMIADLLYYCEKFDCAVGIAGYNIGRGKYFFKEIVYSYDIEEPQKVHIHFTGCGTTFKIRHLHKSILDWRKYEDIEIRYDNEPYLAYIFAKQGTDRYVIPSKGLTIYASPLTLRESDKSQFAKKKQFRKFYKTISGDNIELPDKEIVYGI